MSNLTERLRRDAQRREELGVPTRSVCQGRTAPPMSDRHADFERDVDNTDSLSPHMAKQARDRILAYVTELERVAEAAKAVPRIIGGGIDATYQYIATDVCQAVHAALNELEDTHE